jgi:hypothetical protein
MSMHAAAATVDGDARFDAGAGRCHGYKNVNFLIV